MEEMTNIEIRDFVSVQGVDDSDFVVLSLRDGASGKISMGLLKASVSTSAIPKIKNGVWWIGDIDTGVKAEGLTPEFRKGELGLEWRYASGDEMEWKLAIPFDAIKMRFEDLTTIQREELSLKYSDLTEAEKKELQKPASEMISSLEQTNILVLQAEQERVLAESIRLKSEDERQKTEAERDKSEQDRISSEEARDSAEKDRIENEKGRLTSENIRQSSEDTRIEAERVRAEAERNRASNELTRVESESYREANEISRRNAEQDRISAEAERALKFTYLINASEEATASAQDTADHPTYIGEDNYVYQWNKLAGAYNKTSIYVRGESFSIKKVYSSIEAMYMDNTTPFKEGDFCLIDTGNVEDVDNAKLYVRNEYDEWSFLVDMSGAIGFTGKVPQLFIGSVSAGKGQYSSSVSLSENGVDEEGNPKYNINFVLPCLSFNDLTAEQIVDLQRPASEMILKLEETDRLITSSELERVQSETMRNLNEESRISSEQSRDQAEQARLRSELERAENEQVRIQNEEERAASENTRSTSELERIESEERRLREEATRESSESARVDAEKMRMYNEDNRIEAESQRSINEAKRQDNEQQRLNFENARIYAEGVREESEHQRSLAETARGDAEKEREISERARKEAEEHRAEDYLHMMENLDNAEKDALDAADNANHTPVIKENNWWVWDNLNKKYVDTGTSAMGRSPLISGGTWWVWNDTEGGYSDTGQSVSSDYQLTKEKIEGVFTGVIYSHTHTNLVYPARVYEEVPDFGTLTGWTDENGFKHEFVPGDDIYVVNQSEATGYANYKMAVTVEGNMWVRIPQIPSGYRMVLVKE